MADGRLGTWTVFITDRDCPSSVAQGSDPQPISERNRHATELVEALMRHVADSVVDQRAVKWREWSLVLHRPSHTMLYDTDQSDASIMEKINKSALSCLNKRMKQLKCHFQAGLCAYPLDLLGHDHSLDLKVDVEDTVDGVSYESVPFHDQGEVCTIRSQWRSIKSGGLTDDAGHGRWYQGMFTVSGTSRPIVPPESPSTHRQGQQLNNCDSLHP